MHRLLDPALSDIHYIVLHHLSAEHVANVLPLLGVNKHFRGLAIERMLEEYRKTRVLEGTGGGELPALSEGGYVKVRVPFTLPPPLTTLTITPQFCLRSGVLSYDSLSTQGDLRFQIRSKLLL
jgi:hypothetical protein